MILHITVQVLQNNEFLIGFDVEGEDTIETVHSTSPQKTILSYLKEHNIKGKKGAKKGVKHGPRKPKVPLDLPDNLPF